MPSTSTESRPLAFVRAVPRCRLNLVEDHFEFLHRRLKYAAKIVRKGAVAVTTFFGRSRRAMQEKYLAEIAHRFRVPFVRIPLFPSEIRGLGALAELGEQILGPVDEVAGEDLVARATEGHGV